MTKFQNQQDTGSADGVVHSNKFLFTLSGQVNMLAKWPSEGARGF